MNNFLKRLVAFCVDMMIVSIICSFFSIFLIDQDYNNKLILELNNTYQEYSENSIDEEIFINKSSDISYDILRNNSLYLIVNIGVYLLYFSLYQYKNGGQTIGKKLFKIKVVGVDREPTINDFVFRGLFINYILFDLLNVIMLLFLSKDVYILSNMTLIFIRYLILFICAVMVIFRKDNRGLHDLLGHSKVINL